MTSRLLHGEEETVNGDSGYTARKSEKTQSSKAKRYEDTVQHQSQTIPIQEKFHKIKSTDQAQRAREILRTGDAAAFAFSLFCAAVH